mgnify:CR=1 FL=1
MLTEYEIRLIKIFSISVVLISTISIFFTSLLWGENQIGIIGIGYNGIILIFLFFYSNNKKKIPILLFMISIVIIFAFWYSHSLGAFLSAHHYTPYNSTCESNSTMFYCLKDGLYGSFNPINTSTIPNL